MKIGYGKLGRVLQFDSTKHKFAGEAEAVNVLYRLAARNPHVEWHIIGKSSGVPNSRYANIHTYWHDEDGAKAFWGAKTGGGYECTHCKTMAPGLSSMFLDCCDTARRIGKREQVIADVAGTLDGMVIHLGQHGTSHNFIPKVGCTWNDPPDTSRARAYVWAINYGGYLIRALNRFTEMQSGDGRGNMVWLCPDPRNYLNARDVRSPAGLEQHEPVLAQYDVVLNGVHERYQNPLAPDVYGYEGMLDNGLWRVKHHYRHSGLDMAMLPDDWDVWPQTPFTERYDIGVLSTAAYMPRRDFRRSAMIADWVLTAFPDAPVWGKWDERSRADLPDGANLTVNDPDDFPELLGKLKTTVILPPTPVSMNGPKWCTAKPWQAFAAGAIALMVPPVDAQGWVIPATHPGDGTREIAPGLHSVRDDWSSDDLTLAEWLRPENPEHAEQIVKKISESSGTWEWLALAQRRLLRRRWDLHELESEIEMRLRIP